MCSTTFNLIKSTAVTRISVNLPQSTLVKSAVEVKKILMKQISLEVSFCPGCKVPLAILYNEKRAQVH